MLWAACLNSEGHRKYAIAGGKGGIKVVNESSYLRKEKKVVLFECIYFSMATVPGQIFSQTYLKFMKNTSYPMDIVLEKNI